MESAALRLLDFVLAAIASPWTWIIFLLYIVFLGNERLKVHGILDTGWRAAQSLARVADRLDSMEKKLDAAIEASSKPDDSIRFSVSK